MKLKNELETNQASISQLEKRNKQLMLDIENLKSGTEIIEDYARNELGMIKKNEVFYQVVEVP